MQSEDYGGCEWEVWYQGETTQKSMVSVVALYPAQDEGKKEWGIQCGAERTEKRINSGRDATLPRLHGRYVSKFTFVSKD